MTTGLVFRRRGSGRQSRLPTATCSRWVRGVVELRTVTGETVSGVMRSEDNFTLVIQTEDGRFHSYNKAQLAEVRHTSHSLMPKDFSTRLTPQNLQDLISFLVTNSSTPRPIEHAMEHPAESKEP